MVIQLLFDIQCILLKISLSMTCVISSVKMSKLTVKHLVLNWDPNPCSHNHENGCLIWWLPLRGNVVLCPGLWFNIKMSDQFRNCHCGDKMILWPSYFHNRDSCTKMTFLYGITSNHGPGSSSVEISSSTKIIQWHGKKKKKRGFGGSSGISQSLFCFQISISWAHLQLRWQASQHTRVPHS